MVIFQSASFELANTFAILLQIESSFTLSDVNNAIRRLLGGTYKRHRHDYHTIRRVNYVFHYNCFSEKS